MALRRFLEGVVWVLALYAIAAYVWLALHRCVYPVEIDFIEGAMVDHVTRLAHGQALYVQPSLEYIPLAYMPLFSFASSLVMRLGGSGFFSLRIVSFASSLLLMATMAYVVWRETRRATFAAGAAGIYALAFGLTGACYDVGRPDSMMLMLSLMGLATLRFTRGSVGAIVAALLLTLGFFTKQHSVLFSFGALAWTFFRDRRRFPVFAASIVAGCLGGYVLVTAWLGDWFRVYTWSIPSGWSQVSPSRIEHYLGRGLFGALACSTVPALLSLGLPEEPDEGGKMLWYWTGLAGVGTGMLATLDVNAYLHVFTPTVVAFAVLAPVALDRMHRYFTAQPRVNALAGVTLVAVLAGQFVPLFFGLHQHLPRHGAAEAHRVLLRRLRTFPNGAIVPYHSYYPREAGLKGNLQFIALDDIERSRHNDILRRDPHFLEKMFAPLASGPGRPAIVTDVPLYHTGHLWRGIQSGYALTDSFPTWVTDALRPLTGNQHSITYVYTPVEPPAEASTQ